MGWNVPSRLIQQNRTNQPISPGEITTGILNIATLDQMRIVYIVLRLIIHATFVYVFLFGLFCTEGLLLRFVQLVYRKHQLFAQCKNI